MSDNWFVPTASNDHYYETRQCDNLGSRIIYSTRTETNTDPDHRIAMNLSLKDADDKKYIYLLEATPELIATGRFCIKTIFSHDHGPLDIFLRLPDSRVVADSILHTLQPYFPIVRCDRYKILGERQPYSTSITDRVYFDRSDDTVPHPLRDSLVFGTVTLAPHVTFTVGAHTTNIFDTKLTVSSKLPSDWIVDYAQYRADELSYDTACVSHMEPAVAGDSIKIYIINLGRLDTTFTANAVFGFLYYRRRQSSFSWSAE